MEAVIGPPHLAHFDFLSDSFRLPTSSGEIRTSLLPCASPRSPPNLCLRTTTKKGVVPTIIMIIIIVRDKRDILRRWERFFGNLLNTKSPTLQPSIVEKVQQRRKAPQPPPSGARSQIEEPISLEAEPTYAETQKAVRAMANWKAPGADSLPVELLKLDDPTREPVVLKHSTPFSSVCGEGRKSHRSGKTQRLRCSTRSRTDLTATTSEGFHSSPTPAKYC